VLKKRESRDWGFTLFFLEVRSPWGKPCREGARRDLKKFRPVSAGRGHACLDGKIGETIIRVSLRNKNKPGCVSKKGSSEKKGRGEESPHSRRPWGKGGPKRTFAHQSRRLQKKGAEGEGSPLHEGKRKGAWRSLCMFWGASCPARKKGKKGRHP